MPDPLHLPTAPMTAVWRPSPDAPATAPIPGLHVCGWCGISLSAIPDPPKEFDGRWYHPEGCISCARTRALGVRITPWQEGE